MAGRVEGDAGGIGGQPVVVEEEAARLAEMCLCLHIQRAGRAIGRRFDEALRPLGLTNQQFSLLVTLSRSAAPSIGSLAADLAMDRTTVTANLKPLARRGLVEVRRDGADRRSRRLVLTEQGRGVIAAGLALWREAQEAELQHLPGGIDPAELRRALRALAA